MKLQCQIAMSSLSRFPVGSVSLSGDLPVPNRAPGVVVLLLFAHGSGSGRHGPRNRYVAKVLQEANLGALLFDLLTEDEEIIDEQIGVIYDPSYERYGNNVATILPIRYDAFLFIDETHELHPLHIQYPQTRSSPETYPAGL
jgi:hypothetical protein